MDQRKKSQKSLGKKPFPNPAKKDKKQTLALNQEAEDQNQEDNIVPENTIKIKVKENPKNKAGSQTKISGQKNNSKQMKSKGVKRVQENEDAFDEENNLENTELEAENEEYNGVVQEDERFKGIEVEDDENQDDMGDYNDDDLDDLDIDDLDGEEDGEDQQLEREKNIQKALEFRESQNKKGVLYLSRIPPYMNVAQLRKLFASYGVERLYLTPEDEGKRKFRVKTGGNKRRNYTEGWMEFSDKKVAKYVATVFNGQKIGGKRRSFYTEDVLNLKYLPKFKWENLTEKINYDMKMRKEKLKAELSLAKKQHDHYLDQVEKGKKIMGIKKYKDSKRAALDDIEDALDETVEAEQEEPGMKVSFDNEKDRIRRVFKQKKPKLV